VKHGPVLSAIVLAALTGAAVPAAASSPEALPPLDPGTMATAISGLPDPAVTGAMVEVSGPAGAWSGTSGIRDVRTRRPVPAGGRFRIASISKVFTAVVVLQLAAEHRVDLGRPVQDYLPGLLPAAYPDITVRQLLDHTSGLPYGTLGSGDPAWFVRHRFDSWTPKEVIDEATTRPMRFAPGTQQQYNGTNYYVAGLLVEKVTGHSYADEVGRRILRPLGLHDTFVLDRRDPRLPGPHSHGYVAVTEDGTTALHDVSLQSPWSWAEGGLISSSDDLAKLITRIFEGRLVPRSEREEMFTLPDVEYTGSTSNCNVGPNAGRACFSAGLTTTTLPNGVTVWGKTGSVPGYTNGVFATRDLRRVLVYSMNPTGNADGSETPYVVKIAAATFDPELAAG
jgi:D-alanyl-D-alanine carboxypeptidase